jgi:hypothetical protein
MAVPIVVVWLDELVRPRMRRQLPDQALIEQNEAVRPGQFIDEGLGWIDRDRDTELLTSPSR